jgi:hypothetical protein
MLDTWTADDPAAETTTRSDADSRPIFGAMIRQALERELKRRRGLRAHVQLGVRVDADAAMVDAAHRGLRAHYQPETYRCYGAATMALASSILTLLDQARAELTRRR